VPTAVLDPIDPDLVDLQQGRARANLLQIAWRRKSLIVLGVVAGLIVGTLYYARATPVYQSGGQLMVIKKSGSPLATQGGDPRQSYYEDYLSTHQTLIRSPLIVQRAVKKHQLANLKMFQGQGDPTGDIIAALTITRDPSAPAGSYNNILLVSYRGNVPEECGIVLNAVIDSYKDFLDDSYKAVSNENLASITRVADSLQKSLEQKQKAYGEFKEKSPLVYWKGGEGANPREEWLAQIHTKRLNLVVRRAELQAHVNDIETAIKEGKERGRVLATIAASAARGGAAKDRSFDDQLLQLMAQEQQLLSDYGPDHPAVVAVRKRIGLVKEFYTQSAGGDKKTAKDGAKGPEAAMPGPADPVQWHLLSLKQELAELEITLETLTRIHDNEEKSVREVSKFKEQDRRMLDDINKTQELFQPIIKRLEEIKLVQDMGGYDARVLATPGSGGKVGPVAFQVFALAGLFGFLGGLGLAYLADVTDKSFRTPEEIRSRLGLSLIGHIPVIRPGSAPAAAEGQPLDAALCTYYQPKSVHAEAYRGLRTSLFFCTRGEVHKVIQMTSPNARDGKSTMTSNLGICIAQSGKSILLVDADLRKPRLHKIFGINPTAGLSNVLTDGTDWRTLVVPTPVPGLTMLPCGPRPNNPAELLTTPRFHAVVEELRQAYDFVLIDTPPLLAVSDPSIVAARVDGVVLVLRLVKNGQPNAERAREILAGLGANVFGVVVNGVGRGPGGGNYDYNSNYNYYYDYDYSYNYREESGYYKDEYHDEGEGEGEGDGDDAAYGTRKRRSERPESAAPTEPEPDLDTRRMRRTEEPKGFLSKLFPWWR